MTGDIEVKTPEQLADWIETLLLVSGGGHLSVSQVCVLAREALGVEEHRTHGALGILNQRAEILDDDYPFTVNDIAVLRRSVPRGDFYKALLFLTPASVARQSVRRDDLDQVASLFERLAEHALGNFWGRSAHAVRFGFPSDCGRPKEFDAAVRWLAEMLGISPGHGYRPPLRKDGGVDIVTWRKFRDGRTGFPIALAQCTVQAETFTKTTDIDLRLWASWLAMDFEPTSLLVVPGTIGRTGTEWSQLTTVALVVERLRLVELASEGPSTSLGVDWTIETVNLLRNEFEWMREL